VLVDEYNMDPADHAPSSPRSSARSTGATARRTPCTGRVSAPPGEARKANQDEIYKILNNDRVQLQSMQDLARYGRITFDPFSNEIPSRFPDPRWVDVIEEQFTVFYAKHYNTPRRRRRELHRLPEKLHELRDPRGLPVRRDRTRGAPARTCSRTSSATGPTVRAQDPTFLEPLDVFVRREIQNEYDAQPHLAPSEAIASLRYGFRIGIGQDRPEVWEGANQFVKSVIDYFRNNELLRLRERSSARGGCAICSARMDTTKPRAFVQLITDPTVQFDEKATIWAKVDKYDPMLRLQVYDPMMPTVTQQFARTTLSRNFTIDELFPAPPGLEAWRRALAEERARQEAARQNNPNRPDISRTE
jgi:hypothetical protein